MQRRDFLTGLGLLAATPALAAAESDAPSAFAIKIRGQRAQVKDRPVTVAILGCGNRGSVYANYAERFPECMKVVAVADIDRFRAQRTAKIHSIPAARVFGDWQDCLKAGRLADALIIALPDHLHYRLALEGLDLGYDLLLEKPIAQSAEECRAILAKQQAKGAIVAVAHVLRYAPLFVALKEALDRGTIGELVSVIHREAVSWHHFAQAYVRGLFGNSKESTPVILAKSCHDLDLMRWFVGQPCKRVSADGSLTLFRPERAPQGAPMRCTDGCPHEATCPFSAIQIYARDQRGHHLFNKPDDVPWNYDFMYETIKTHRVGRCVYHCHNDQPDHYVMEMEFANGVTGSFTMDGFNFEAGRKTRLVGTEGCIESDGRTQFTIHRFNARKPEDYRGMVWKLKDVVYEGEAAADHGHGGGDHALCRDFVEAISYRDESRLTSTLASSVESHLMGFAAERSRHEGRKVEL